jgi:hypothetical protein
MDCQQKECGFFHDINGDKCQKTLAGFIVLFVAISLSVITVIYALIHRVEASSLITTIILGLYGVGGSLLSLTTFTKQREASEDPTCE